MRRIQERMIPLSCHGAMVLFITICLLWVGCGPKDVRQESDWADLNQQVEELWAKGHYVRAVPLAEKALSVAKAQYGRDHPAVALSLNSLGALYHIQCRYAEAEPLFKQSLKIWEETLGPEHLNVANCLYGLAGLYISQGKFAEAEPLNKQSLEILETAFGSEHPQVATACENIAYGYRKVGKVNKAEKYEARARAIRSKQ